VPLNALGNGKSPSPRIEAGDGQVPSVKVVEKRVSEEVAIGQAAMGGNLVGSASISGGASSAMPSICM
jgi:hypothetical protein